jgi:hypothetical protein
MFDGHGNIKNYTPKTLMTLDIMYPFIALLSYYLILVIKITLDS